MKASLKEYRRKRDFSRTAEPEALAPTVGPQQGGVFSVQKHATRRLHYDLRLEMGGVLKSWAVPKGPSLDPEQRRLAVHVEDHPLAYASFEGEIPKGQYGGGTVLVWDRGRWLPQGDAQAGYQKGHMRFMLQGRKLGGSWSLVAMGRDRKNWLLIKHADEESRKLAQGDILVERPESVLGGRRHIPGARPGRLPGSLSPQLATLMEQPPEGDDWIHELKFDGYRILAFWDGRHARLLTREANDWTRRFPSVAAAVSKLGPEPCLLDGEVVMLDDRGRPDFQALQNAMKAKSGGQPVYFAFDLLHLGGLDLRPAPLLERKKALAALLRAADAKLLRYSDHLQGHGREFLRQACAQALEGVVSKRAQAPYESRRSADWVKVKCRHEQEFVVGGFTEPAGSRQDFGALLLGVREQGRLRYVGKVGTGFTQASLRDIHGRLKALQSARSPFSGVPRGLLPRSAHWVRPELVAEVSFANWTSEQILRQASFHGLREDKPAVQVSRESPQAELSNPERVLYPEQDLTKRDLADYYARVAGLMLPHIAARPLALLRCPSGRGRCFYQKHASGSLPKALRTVEIEERGTRGPYVYVEDLAGLTGLVQLGVLEIHPWGCRVSDLEHPDLMTFDLDPDPALPWSAVAVAARELRGRLSYLGLESFVKLTGGKGLHVIAPLEPRAAWQTVHDFSKAVALEMVRSSPGSFTASSNKQRRAGKIFIDYMRNARGAMAIAPYSTRARPGAPIAMPISWAALADPPRPTVQSFKAGRDPWAGLEGLRQSLRP